MKDINQHIMEQSLGACRFNPDEQKKFLETFAERVLLTCSLDEANSPLLLEHFPEVLKKITADYQPVFVKISPNVETKQEVAYMKIAHELGCQTTIVSADCQYSPFGLVIHTDHAVNLDKTALLEKFPDLFAAKKTAGQKKTGLWAKLFG